MKRLMTKHWKVIAYLVGLMWIAQTQSETIGTIYGGIGLAWFVCWLLWTSMVTHSIAMGMPRDDTSLKAVVIWNRRLLAYLAGLIPVGLVGSEILTGLYLGFGLVWVASWSWKNRHLGGGRRMSEFSESGRRFDWNEGYRFRDTAFDHFARTGDTFSAAAPRQSMSDPMSPYFRSHLERDY